MGRFPTSFMFVAVSYTHLLYKNECQNWRNKINRVKNTAGFPADRLEKEACIFSRRSCLDTSSMSYDKCVEIVKAYMAVLDK